jgi:PAS domain S-box-containing protein
MGISGGNLKFILAGLLCWAVFGLSSGLAHAAGPKDKPVLRVGVRSLNSTPTFLERLFAKPPMAGANLRLVEMLASALGVKMRFVVVSTHLDRRRLLRKDKIDLIVLDSPQLTSDDAFDFVPLGLHINRQLFVHKSRQDIFSLDDLNYARIAVIAGDNFRPHLRNALGCTLEVMDGPHQALQALDAGKLDAFLSPSARTAENIINLEELQNVVKVGLTIERIEMCLTIRRDNRELKQALQNAVEHLNDTGQLKVLHEKWYDVHYSPNPWKDILRWGAAGTLLTLLAVVLVLTINLRLKSRVVKVTRDLRSSEERYRELILSSPDMVLVLDEEGKIHHSNPVADQFVDLPDQKSVGSNLNDFVPPDERATLKEFIAQTFAEGKGHREFKMQDHKGVLHEVDVAARVLPTTGGEGPRICCFARDVTQRNLIERELMQADRLSTIGKMAASVAHEINNPLGIVRANVELLLAKNMYSPDAKEFLEAIKRNAIRAGQTTQELLAAAKPKTPEMRQVNLEELTRMVLGMLGAQFKNIQVAQLPAKRPPLVFGDPNLLQQVLLNLFLNAKSAMNESQERRLTIRFCHNCSEDSVCMRIEDTGRGIDKKYLNEIFEPFFTSGKKEGFGLGLFITRRIIERHGGIIFAESEQGRGAYFIVELPSLMAIAGDTQSIGAL